MQTTVHKCKECQILPSKGVRETRQLPAHYLKCDSCKQVVYDCDPTSLLRWWNDTQKPNYKER